MVALTVWTTVILLAVVGIAITMSLGQGTWTGGVLSPMPMRVAVAASAAVSTHPPRRPVEGALPR